MSYKELSKLSHEDLHIFEECLTAFFKMSMEDSFTQLRNYLKMIFPQSRFSNADELIDDSITRLIVKVVEFEKKGERIANLKAFASRVASLILLEHSRARGKPISTDPDDSTDKNSLGRSELRYQPDVDIRGIERELKVDCMTTCLEKLSQEKRALLLAYYPDDSVKRAEVLEIRRKLANQEAEEPLQVLGRELDNLRVKISKLRSKLSECLENCVEAKQSRNAKLVYLYGQQSRT